MQQIRNTKREMDSYYKYQKTIYCRSKYIWLCVVYVRKRHCVQFIQYIHAHLKRMLWNLQCVEMVWMCFVCILPKQCHAKAIAVYEYNAWDTWQRFKSGDKRKRKKQKQQQQRHQQHSNYELCLIYFDGQRNQTVVVRFRCLLLISLPSAGFVVWLQTENTFLITHRDIWLHLSWRACVRACT